MICVAPGPCGAGGLSSPPSPCRRSSGQPSTGGVSDPSHTVSGGSPRRGLSLHLFGNILGGSAPKADGGLESPPATPGPGAGTGRRDRADQTEGVSRRGCFRTDEPEGRCEAIPRKAHGTRAAVPTLARCPSARCRDVLSSQPGRGRSPGAERPAGMLRAAPGGPPVRIGSFRAGCVGVGSGRRGGAASLRLVRGFISDILEIWKP